MGYVIMTDSRKCDDVLFMVDRRRQRRSFWSNRLDDAFVYANRRAAERKAASLRFNNPRAVSIDEARRIERLQLVGSWTFDEADMSWDAHKDTW